MGIFHAPASCAWVNLVCRLPTLSSHSFNTHLLLLLSLPGELMRLRRRHIHSNENRLKHIMYTVGFVGKGNKFRDRRRRRRRRRTQRRRPRRSRKNRRRPGRGSKRQLLTPSLQRSENRKSALYPFIWRRGIAIHGDAMNSITPSMIKLTTMMRDGCRLLKKIFTDKPVEHNSEQDP
jgi:hypothetical protein